MTAVLNASGELAGMITEADRARLLYESGTDEVRHVDVVKRVLG